MEDKKQEVDEVVKADNVKKAKKATKKKEKKVSLWKIIKWTTIVLLTVSVLFLAFVLVYKMDASKKLFDTYKASLPNYNDSPVLVFKEVDFYKYLIRGKPVDTNAYLDELQVFLVKGKADFGFDLSCVNINEIKTNYVTRTLVLEHKSSSFFPIFVDVQIPSADIKEVKTIIPQRVSEDEANKTAKTVGVLTAGAGGIFSGMAASKVSSAFTLNPIKKLATGATVGILGGAGLGAASYVMTKNFLMELDLAGNLATEREIMLEKAKVLIALELLGDSNTVNTETDLKEWEQMLVGKYENELKKALEEFFKPFGWKNVELEFLPKN